MTERDITGRTRIYGILADPIHHVKTPEVMNALFARHGVDGVLVPFHVTADGLATLLSGLRRMENFGGFIATVPHKTAMLDLCDVAEPEARLIGAVNCVRREPGGSMTGAMLDGIGFVEGLRAAGYDPAERSVYLAGAGGAAKAIAFALAGAGIARIAIANRSRDKAEALGAALAAARPDLPVSVAGFSPEGEDLVINATSLGMRPDDPPPLDLGALQADQVVAEVIMDPERTPLLKAAAARGCRTQPGRPMLASQIELMARHMRAIS
jgi:shikimate dehydrogenase